MTRILVGLTLTFAAFASSTPLHAQQGGSPKVAIVNVGMVFFKYEKAKFFKSEMEAALKPFKAKGEAIRADIVKYGTYLKENAAKIPEKDKDAYQKYLVAKQRELEDVDREARDKVGKRQEEQIVTLFKELAAATQAYAKANGIELVMGYGQQIEGDLYSVENIQRIMSGMDLGTTTPLYLGLGVDISQAIVDTLNHHYRQAGGATVPGTPTGLQKN